MALLPVPELFSPLRPGGSPDHSTTRPDLLHVHNRPLLALWLARRFGREIPVILHMHNLYESLGKRERPRPGTPIPVAGFAACSNFVLERERSRLGLGAGLYRVIYNGVETDAFTSIWDHEPQRRQVRQQYGLEDEPTVVFAGKLRESKGVHILLRAMTRVWETDAPGGRWCWWAAPNTAEAAPCGRPRLWRQLRRDLAQAPGRVILTGFIPPTDMPRAYLLGDVFVGPSQIEEGLGLVFLEAAAAGLPIIATRKGGIPEVVRDDFNGLLLRQPDDATELAEKITGLLNDAPLRQRLGQQGRDWVRADFSWEKIARTLEAFYDEVMEQGSGVQHVVRAL